LKAKTKKHVLELPERTVVCTVSEQPNRVVVHLEFSRVGAFDSDIQLANWLTQILERYQKGRRPIGFDNDLSRDAALVATLGKPILAALFIAWGEQRPS
jgi:hypothetical protein